MAALAHRADIKPADKTMAAIDAAVVRDTDQAPRQHLGASQIGKPCARALWYSFRWAKRSTFDGRMLRLFARGQREEDSLSQLLRDAGIEVVQVDPATGRQFQFASHGGHFGGSMDGAARNVPEAPQTWHVVEYKTHGKKSFDKLAEGVKIAKPEHWAQMQCYMGWTGMDRALYVAVCKDDDRLHIERIDADKDAQKVLIDNAGAIIFAGSPPYGISNDPSWFECKFCDYHALCHAEAVPEVTCRSCAHATPERDGAARWSCALADAGTSIPLEFQRTGCDAHRYIPVLLSRFAEPVNGSAEGNWIEYRIKATGEHFCNGEGGARDYKSREIHAASDKRCLGDALNVAIRDEFPGTEVVG